MATQTQTLTQKTATKKAVQAPARAKTQTAKKAETTKAHSFKIAAGFIVSIQTKELNKALSYHTKAGNLEKTETGYKLTSKGSENFNKRISEAPELFQKVAAFVHGKGEIPEVWAKQKSLHKVTASHTFPNQHFWGQFATREMRLAFASLWAK